MSRKLIAVLLGLVTAFALVLMVERAGHAVYPPPPGLNFNDPAQVAEYVALMPIGAMAFLLAAWSLAALVGGLVACRIAGERPLVFASIIGAVVMAATIANLVMIPPPAWFSITAILLIAVATLLAARMSARR